MKRSYLAPVLAAGLLALSACGSSGSSATSNAPTTAPSAAGSTATDSTAAGSTDSTGAGSTDSGAAGSTESSAPGSGSTESSSAGSGSTESSSAGSGASDSSPASSSSSAGGSGVLPAEPGSVTVGSAGFPENVLLANIYGDAMAAKGVKVSKHLNIGERSVYLTALKGGEIGFVPEYSGSILLNLNPNAAEKSSADVDAALKKAAAGAGFATTKSAPAQDADTITVTKATADKYKLKSIADLKSVAGGMTFGAPAQFKTRADGIPGLEKVYGVKFGTFTPTDAGGSVTVNALKSGSLDAADIFSTDPAIAQNGFVSLADPQSMFAAQNVVPLFSQKVLTKPMADACDAVSEKLDTKTLASLRAKVSGDNSEAVAQEWLKSVNLG